MNPEVILRWLLAALFVRPELLGTVGETDSQRIPRKNELSFMCPENRWINAKSWGPGQASIKEQTMKKQIVLGSTFAVLASFASGVAAQDSLADGYVGLNYAFVTYEEDGISEDFDLGALVGNVVA